MVYANWDDISNASFRFISIKDPHMNFGFQNKIRFNNDEDLTNKWMWLLNYMLEQQVKHLVITGDLTNSNDEKKWSFKQYILNKQILELFILNGIQVHSVMGNHDMFNGMEQINNTVFGELVKENVINHLSSKPLIIETEKGNIAIYGVDYSKNLDNVREKLQYVNDKISETNNISNIVVFHSHVTPAEIAITDFTYESLLKDYPYIDLFICGHYHGGFPFQVFYKGGLTSGSDHVGFVNNWSFQRVVRDYYNELNVHTPEISDIKLLWSEGWNRQIFGVKNVLIPCNSYELTFKPKVIDLLKYTRKEQFIFFEKINFDNIKTGDDDIEILKLIAEEDKCSPEIINLAIQYLSEVQVDDVIIQ